LDAKDRMGSWQPISRTRCPEPVIRIDDAEQLTFAGASPTLFATAKPPALTVLALIFAPPLASDR